MSYQAFVVLELARARLKEAEQHRLAVEARRARNPHPGPHPLRRFGARFAVSVSEVAAGLARSLDDRVFEIPHRDVAP
jgi:hypothetical protein